MKCLKISAIKLMNIIKKLNLSQMSFKIKRNKYKNLQQRLMIEKILMN